MRFTLQTKFGQNGNCVQACVATLFGLEISDIPEFEQDDNEWCFKFSDWLRDRLGKFLMTVELNDESHIKLLSDSYCLSSINSPHPLVDRHAVITKGDRIIFDPMEGEVDKPVEWDENPVFYIIGDILK